MAVLRNTVTSYMHSVTSVSSLADEIIKLWGGSVEWGASAYCSLAQYFYTMSNQAIPALEQTTRSHDTSILPQTAWLQLHCGDFF